jgi:cell division protein FtsL
MIRSTTLLAILLAAALSLVLFTVKYQVQDLETELTGLERGIVGEERAIHVLRAEWSHLNDPERLRELAQRYLGMGPVSARQLETFDDLADRKTPEDESVHPASVQAAASQNSRGGRR